jgi:NAD(P)-dependent dehydrogenase (short-subunit alcohol dehydrogenase family)
MLTSVVSGIRNVRQYPELAGARVLITGVSADKGVDIARGFAEAGSRLVLQIAAGSNDDDAERNAALLQVLSNTAAEIRSTEQPIDGSEETVRFAQGAAQAFGGLDVVINVIAPKPGILSHDSSIDDIEDAVANTLRSACLITKIAANRMNLTWTEGLVLNIIVAQKSRTKADAVFSSILGQALATMTRVEAGTWAQKGIRINGVGPRADAGLNAEFAAQGSAYSLSSEADIAALSLHLASKRGQSLSGHVFDAEGVAARRC